LKQTKWIFPQHNPEQISTCAAQTGLSETAVRILFNRGIDTPEAITRFLSYENFNDPMQLPGMKQAVEQINLAINAGEKIAVYGDYDVDGITSTYVVCHYLRSVGAQVTYYIPDRAEEGYGLNCNALDTLKSQGIGMVITVDVGITAVEEAAHAKQIGLTLVITDHHSLKEELPDAPAVVNPKIPSDQCAFRELAGVGVAFKLVCALSGNSPEIFWRYCDITAIGTIADMVPLIDENRYIVCRGLEKLRDTQNIGIRTLLEVAGLANREITASTIGFGLSPRLNAAGRLGNARDSVELLFTDNPEQAHTLAVELDKENRTRQSQEHAILKEAQAMIVAQGLQHDGVIVVAGHGWHHGVIGIVSSRITEAYYKPSIVISVDESGNGKGSGRSVQGFNLFAALNVCSKHLTKFGGHEMAAGLSLHQDDIDAFRIAINHHAAPLLTEEILTPKLYPDDTIAIQDVNLKTIDSLKFIEPCGVGNRSPLFCIRNAKIRTIRNVTNGKHVFLTVEQNGYTAELPAFGMMDAFSLFSVGDMVDVVGALSTNTYGGVTRPQFIIRDFKPAESLRLTRDQVGCAYRFFRVNGSGSYTLSSLKQHLISSGLSCAPFHIQLCMDVMKELGFIDYKKSSELFAVTIQHGFGDKTSLEQSKTFMRFNRERKPQ